jgi:uncharacterized DUF497 family protein
MQFDGFDWDDGNWPKCGKHGVGKEEIEAMLLDRHTRVFPDPAHSTAEIREIAIGVSPLRNRPMAVFFTRRMSDDLTFVRPFSARYVHDKEFRKYEQTRPR